MFHKMQLMLANTVNYVCRWNGLLGIALARSLRLPAATGQSAFGTLSLTVMYALQCNLITWLSRQLMRVNVMNCRARWRSLALPPYFSFTSPRSNADMTTCAPLSQGKTEKPQVTLQGHSGHVEAVVWDPSHDEHVASAADDKTVRCQLFLCSRCYSLPNHLAYYTRAALCRGVQLR